MKRIGKSVMEFEKTVAIEGFAAVVGQKEGEGPLGAEFDLVIGDSYFGKKSWEQAEAEFQATAFRIALEKAGATSPDMDMIFAGDLLNQCIASSFGAIGADVPFLGQYGACSTMGQNLIMAAMAVESGAADMAAAVTSSHFCTAERQFRLPLEYGGQRTPSAQWTATGSGCAIVGSKGRVMISRAAVGKIKDLGVKDAANMGAAMAPAAANTIFEFLYDTGTSPEDYDAIFTGDLGLVGRELLCELLSHQGLDISKVHNDCGLMMYYLKEQDVHAGGSGCGCCASVLCGHILPRMERGALKRILFCPTGALMSTISSQQGQAIPGICHAVELVSE